MGSSDWSGTIGLPLSRYCPRFTWRMPSRPENGARMVLREIVARISPIRAVAPLHLRVGAVPLGLGGDALLAQPRQPVEADLRERGLGVGGGELRELLLDVELDERVALPDGLARLEGDLLDDAGKVGADDDALHGGDRADGRQGGRPLLGLRDDGRHGLGRHDERRLHRHAFLDLVVLDRSDARDEHGRHGEHQDHSLLHRDQTSRFTPAKLCRMPKARCGYTGPPSK